MKCINDIVSKNTPCSETGCRFWIEYKDDLNCTHVAIYKYGALKLQDIGDRLHLTAARIKQLEDASLKKISKCKNSLKVLGNLPF